MTEEIKKEQEELAALQFSMEEIKTITESEVDQLSFDRGRLKAQAEVRRSMLQLAKQGSTPAQKQFLSLITEKVRSDKEVSDLLKWAKPCQAFHQQVIIDVLNWLNDKDAKSPREIYG